jgi:8-oxo-dGTP diphosphatase
MNFEEFNRIINDTPFPPLTVDVIIIVEAEIVLIKRKYPPYGWALPGGFVEKGESVEEAVRREALEETGLELKDLRQFHVYSDPKRDLRFHTVTVVFYANGKGVPFAASDASSLKMFDLFRLPEEIAFDHREIIEDYMRQINSSAD